MRSNSNILTFADPLGRVQFHASQNVFSTQKITVSNAFVWYLIFWHLQIRWAECSLRNGFGLKLIHRFFNVPFLTLQVEFSFLSTLSNKIKQIHPFKSNLTTHPIKSTISNPPYQVHPIKSTISSPPHQIHPIKSTPSNPPYQIHPIKYNLSNTTWQLIWVIYPFSEAILAPPIGSEFKRHQGMNQSSKSKLILLYLFLRQPKRSLTCTWSLRKQTIRFSQTQKLPWEGLLQSRCQMIYP